MVKQKADQRLLFVCNISENVSEQGSGSDRGELTFLSSPISNTKAALSGGFQWRRVQDSNLCIPLTG